MAKSDFTITEDTNLFASPRAGAPVLQLVKAGTKVAVTKSKIDVKGEGVKPFTYVFSEITVDGVTGYVLENYLQ